MQPELPKLKEQGVDFYIIAQGNANSLKDFFSNNDVTAHILLDQGIFKNYGIRAIPVTLIFDKKGEMRQESVGWGPQSLEPFLKYLEQLIKE